MASPQKIFGQLNDNPTITYFFNRLYSPTSKILLTPAVQQQPPHQAVLSPTIWKTEATINNQFKPHQTNTSPFHKARKPHQRPQTHTNNKNKVTFSSSTEHPKKIHSSIGAPTPKISLCLCILSLLAFSRWRNRRCCSWWCAWSDAIEPINLKREGIHFWMEGWALLLALSMGGPLGRWSKPTPLKISTGPRMIWWFFIQTVMRERERERGIKKRKNLFSKTRKPKASKIFLSIFSMFW